MPHGQFLGDGLPILTVQHVAGDDQPVLEAAGTLTDPIWTPVDYELVRLSPVLVSLTFPQPELGAFTYYRVATSVTAPSASRRTRSSSPRSRPAMVR